MYIYYILSGDDKSFLNLFMSRSINLARFFCDFWLICLFFLHLYYLYLFQNVLLCFYLFECSLLFPLLILFLSWKNKHSFWDLKRFILSCMFISFILSLFLFSSLSLPTDDLSFTNLWIGFSVFNAQTDLVFFVISNYFYLDGISIFFIILTTFLFPICVIISWYSLQDKVMLFLTTLCVLEFFLVNCFFVSNLFYFFICFEAILLPMFFIIGIWGSRDRKIHAVFQFLLYTLVGSIFLYIALFYLFFFYDSLDYLVLKNIHFTFIDQCILFILLFISFSFKIPLFPVHIWLPEAHVEAPTFGSVLLAGLLLKLGTYGLLRFVIPLFPLAVSYFMPLIFTLVIIGIFYTSFSTTRQLDLKKIIAYSSVGHMGFVILGLFTASSAGIAGSLYLMLGHGIISSALFICIGILYDRYHTRSVLDLRGLVQFMPLFSIFFLIFTLANVSFPGTFNFVAEMSILIALGQVNIVAAILSVFSIIFIMVYAFWLYNRVMYGNNTLVLGVYAVIGKYMDVSPREFIILLLLAFLTLLFGFFPNIIVNWFSLYCVYISILYSNFF